MSIDELYTKEICKQLKDFQGKRLKAFGLLSLISTLTISLGIQVESTGSYVLPKAFFGLLVICFILVMLYIFNKKLNLDLKNHIIIFCVNKNLYQSRLTKYLYIIGLFIFLFCLFSFLLYFKHQNIFMVIPPASIYSLISGMAVLLIFYFFSFPVYLIFKTDFLILSLETKSIFSSTAKNLGNIEEYLHLNTGKRDDITADLHKYGYSVYDDYEDDSSITMSEVLLLKRKNEFKQIFIAPHNLRDKLD